MAKYTRHMNESRRRLEEALGLGKGEEGLAVNDQLHGLHVLEKSRISKLEQRQVQRDNMKSAGHADGALLAHFRVV